MLQLRNRTPFEATLFAASDPDGVESLFAIVKGSFGLATPSSPADVQEPIAYADRYLGEPGTSSLAVGTDLSLMKRGTDVLLQGHAHAPRGRRVSQVLVSLRVASVVKSAIVFGDRVWEGGLLSPRASPPAVFESVPLIWENSFGGIDPRGGREGVEAEERNPVGAGFRARDSRSPVTGSRLPNLEDPRRLLSSPSDRPAPIGFGPICPHWQPRRSYVGTYDESWTRSRSPYLPKDFDSRFFQLAPPDQIVPDHLKGGEIIEIEGVSAAGAVRFEVPRQRILVTYRLDKETRRCPASLDTLVLKPEESRALAVWRAGIACDKKTLRVREVEIDLGPKS